MRMLLPFLIAMAILLGTFWAAIWESDRVSTEHAMATSVDVVQKHYRLRVAESNALMISLGRALADDEGLRQAFEARDRRALLDHAMPLFNSMNENSGIAHLYFIEPDRKCFLRVHRPDSFGDTINRGSLLEAEATGEVAAAVEYSSAGTNMLRVVTPWKHRGTVLGYIELSIELSYVMKQMQEAFDLDLILWEGKHELNEEKWRLASLGYGRLTSWGRYEHFVVRDNTMGVIPPPLVERLNRHALEEKEGKHKHSEDLVGNYKWNGHVAQVIIFPLRDLKGRALGDLAVIEDITAARANVAWAVSRIMLICGGVVTLLALFLYFLASRVENDLNARTERLKLENLERRKAETNLLAIQQELEERVEARTRELRRERTEMRLLFDLVPAMIWFKDTKNNHLRVNKFAADASNRTVEDMEGKSAAYVYPEEAAKYYEDDLIVINSKKPKLGIIEYIVVDGEPKWIQTDKVPYFDDEGNVIGILVMAQDITERRRSEKELEATQKKLLEVSRQSGMAEVATSVLHNVGNVLNSVNVATTLVSDRLKNSKATNIGKVAAMFEEHKDDLPRFLTADPRGKQLPAYFANLAKHLSDEHEQLQTELRSLQKNVEHIKDIVAMQQSYAKVYGVTEVITAVELVEDALHLNAGALVRHEIEVIREFDDVPPMAVEKHKVLQILVNLIRNAKYACDESGRSQKMVILKIQKLDDDILISIQDNGVGILEENLERIFGHGFTTRAEGHGFGLHNSALVARELGGSLEAFSEGPGKGARFTLRLPLIPPTTAV